MLSRSGPFVLGALTGLLTAAPLAASAADAPAPPPPAAAAPLSPTADVEAPKPADTRDIRTEIPLVGLTYSAFGSSARTLGLAGFGGVANANGWQGTGGGRIFGSPVDRLTLMAEVGRRVSGEAAPSASMIVRIAGDRARGWAVSGLASYRAEGFAELAGEVEIGALASFSRNGWHADANLITGFGVEEREADGELRLRAGYDVARWLRVGLDSRVRYRLAGDHALAGGRTWDAVGGPEMLFGGRHFFVALATGPSTVGVASGVGVTATAALGGAFFF